MMRAVGLGALCGAALLLGGCQSSPLTSWMFRDVRPAAGYAPLEAIETSLALEEGRAFLKQGRISSAIASFQVARLDPTQSAEANNGLAIAYASLGRSDLAARYFKAAVSSDPTNSKYAANLLRLQNSLHLAAKRDASRLAAVSPPRRAPVAQAEPQTRGPIVRLSRAEVFVRSPVGAAAQPPLAVVQYGPPVSVLQPAPSVSSAPGIEVADATDAVATNSPFTIYFPE